MEGSAMQHIAWNAWLLMEQKILTYRFERMQQLMYPYTASAFLLFWHKSRIGVPLGFVAYENVTRNW